MQYLLDRNDGVSHLDPLLLIPRIEHIGDILRTIEEKGIDYALVILDLKEFHKVNSQFGYDIGDKVIEEFARTLRASFLPSRSFSLRFRHGDEFLFFLPSDASIFDIFENFRKWSELHNYPAISYTKRSLVISFHYAAIPRIDFERFPVTEDGISELLNHAEDELRKVKPDASFRIGVPDRQARTALASSAWQKGTSLYIRLTKILINFKNYLLAALALLTVLFGIERAIRLVTPKLDSVLPQIATATLNTVYSLFMYYLDVRFMPIAILFFFLSFKLISQKQDNQQLLLALSERSEISDSLEETKKSLPANHYLLYIHGKVGAEGLEVRQRLGPKIIEAINKNIKKHEHVYWSALDEIAMIIYEVNERDESYFLEVLRRKMLTEIGQEDANIFFGSLRFSSTQVRERDSLKDVEDRTRWKLSQGMISNKVNWK